MSASGSAVYRYLDQYDITVYVGRTGRGPRRGEEHGRRAEFWEYVVRQEVEHLPSADTADRRERELIRAYRPPFNKQHNPDWPALRAAYLALIAAGGPPHTDPITAYAAFRVDGRRRPLELEPIRAPVYDGTYDSIQILRTRPEASPLVPHLWLPQPVPVVHWNGRSNGSALIAIEPVGLFALFHVEGARVPYEARVIAGLRFVNKGKRITVSQLVCHGRRAAA